MKQTDNLDTNFSRNDPSVLQALSAKYRFIIWYIYVKKRKNETQNDLPGGLKLAEIEDRSCHLNFELVGLCKARLQVAENKIKKKKRKQKFDSFVQQRAKLHSSPLSPSICIRMPVASATALFTRFHSAPPRHATCHAF